MFPFSFHLFCFLAFLIDTDIVTAVGWSTDGQLMSCSDDKTLVAWGADGESKGKVSNTSAFVTRLDWFPGTGKQAPDIFAVSCAGSLQV